MTLSISAGVEGESEGQNHVSLVFKTGDTVDLETLIPNPVIIWD